MNQTFACEKQIQMYIFLYKVRICIFDLLNSYHVCMEKETFTDIL